MDNIKNISEDCLRWNPYVLFRGEDEISSFLGDFKKTNVVSTLFVLGKGFDMRMNDLLRKYVAAMGKDNLDCTLIDYNEGPLSPSRQYQKDVESNIKELEDLIHKDSITERKIEMWSNDGYQSRRVSSTNAAFVFNNYGDIAKYDLIIVDISSMPRSIYFAIIGKLLYIIDNQDNNRNPNLFIAVSENAEIDAQIIDTGLDEHPVPIHGFDSHYSRISYGERPLIWLPILGENKQEHLNRTFQFFENPPDEICPIIPFPSKNPRRGDEILLKYHELLFDKFQIEKQNILHGSEQNPFETYRKICCTLGGYFNSLEIIGGCKAAISAYSSKLLSIGGLLAAYELNNRFSLPVGLLNIESQGYQYIDENIPINHSRSDECLIWLTGDPYEQ
jgi:hypothetical protein